MIEYFESARETALKAHADQSDKLGVPYGAHVSHVAQGASQFGSDAEAVGWLHDIVEDCDASLDAIRRRYGGQVSDGVDAMTRRDEEGYFDAYLPRLMKNRLGVIVKFFDSRHNLGKVHLLKDGRTKDRLAAKYPRVLDALLEAAPELEEFRRVPALIYVDGSWVESGDFIC